MGHGFEQVKMKHVIAFIGLMLSVMPGAAAYADSSEIVVENAWSRASIGTARPGVAYMKIANGGEEPVFLTGLRSDIAKMPQVHKSSTNAQGISSMASASEIEIAAGETLALEPGGFHAMLMGLNRPMLEGESYELTLIFSDGDPVTVNVPIFGIAARGPEH